MTAHVPCSHVGCGAKFEPSDNRDADNRDEGQDGGYRLDLSCEPRPDNINKSEEPNHADARCRKNHRILQRREKIAHVPDPNDRQRDVADPASKPVEQVCLIPDERSECPPRIRVGAARTVVDRGHLGIDHSQADRPGDRNRPTKNRNPSGGGQIGREHKNSRPHDISSNHKGGWNDSDFT